VEPRLPLPGVEPALDVGDLIRARQQAGVRALTGPSFVFRPGGVQTGNVYTSWAAVAAAIAATPGRRWLLVDSTIAAAHMTAGGPYDLDNIEISGQNTGGTESLVIDVGATFTSTSMKLTNGIDIASNATSTPWTTSTFTELVLEFAATLVCNAGAAPFLRVTAAGTFSDLFLQNTSGLGDGTHNVVTIDAGQELVVRPDLALLAAHATTGAGTCQVFAHAESIINLPQDVTTFTVTNVAVAPQVAYTPAVPGNWAGAAPATVQAALDRIAAKTPGA
jgi:hypothetical protein